MNQLKEYFKERKKEKFKREIEEKLKVLNILKESSYIRVHIKTSSSRKSEYLLSLETLSNIMEVPLHEVFNRKEAKTLFNELYYSFLTIDKDTPIYNYIVGRVEHYLNLQKSKN